MNGEHETFAAAVRVVLAAQRGADTRFGFVFVAHYSAYGFASPVTGERLDVQEHWLPFLIPAETFLADALGDGPRGTEEEVRASLIYDDTNEPIALPPAMRVEVAPALYSAVVAQLRAEGQAKLPGFGKFGVREKRVRDQPPKPVLTFKPSVTLRQDVKP